jgi:diguanylate cyclase (GGDEF)-like protein
VPLLKRFKLRSFRQTVVALVWVSVSIPVLMIGVYQVRNDYEQRVSRDKRELEHQVERASFAVSRIFHHLMSDLDVIASDGSVIRSLSLPILSPVAVTKFGEFLDTNTSASFVVMVDEELFPLEVIPTFALTEDLGPYEGFMRQIIASPESISDPRPRLFVPPPADGDGRTIAFARPIISPNDSVVRPFEVTGLLLVVVPLERLVTELLDQIDGSYDVVQFKDGQDVIYQTGSMQASKTYQHSTLLPLGRDNQSLSIGLAKSAEGVWRKILFDYRLAAFLALAFLVAMLVIVIRLANKLSHPLQMLTDVTASMNASFHGGTLPDVDTSSVRYREFAEVFDLLKTMDRTINKQFRMLHEANASLEDKVAERTAELEQNVKLLDKQRQSFASLVRYSLDIQKTDSLEQAGDLTLALAQHIDGQQVGLYVLRNDNFGGYRNFDSLSSEYRQVLADHAVDVNNYRGLLDVARQVQQMHFFPIGSSEAAYQGFLVADATAGSAETGEAITILCAMLGAVIEQHSLTGRLHRLAHTDSVTGLHNRHYFTSQLKEKVDQYEASDGRSEFAVFVIDVNGLKYINDHYGHKCGDQMLEIVGTALAKFSRASDTVARVGGDEFYILLEAAGVEACETYATRLRDEMARLNMTIDQETLPITFSFGYATTATDPVKQLLISADERMYAEKKKHYASLAS